MGGELQWIRTVGAPTPGDPRDGELHQIRGPLPSHFDLEPWEETSAEGDVRYHRTEDAPVVDENNHTLAVVDSTLA